MSASRQQASFAHPLLWNIKQPNGPFAPIAVVGNPRPNPVDFQMRPLGCKIAQLAKTQGSRCHRAERTI
jgi:hypothetical protein